MIYARENPAPEDLAPGNCTSLSSNLTMMLNNSYFNSTRVREEARGSMANSLSMEEMLLEVRSPSPSTPFPQDSAIPVDLAEGSGAAEFMANMLRWENLRNDPDPAYSHVSRETLLGMEVNQGNGSNATDSMLDEDSSSTGCSSNDCRHHTYDTLTRQLRGGGEVFLLN